MLSSLRSRVLVLFTLAQVACGSTPSGSSESACEGVAEHMVQLAMQDNGTSTAPPEGIRQELAAQCKREAWSKQRRTCLVLATTQEDTLSCPLK